VALAARDPPAAWPGAVVTLVVVSESAAVCLGRAAGAGAPPGPVGGALGGAGAVRAAVGDLTGPVGDFAGPLGAFT
jgi:hypothetical protein